MRKNHRHCQSATRLAVQVINAIIATDDSKKKKLLGVTRYALPQFFQGGVCSALKEVRISHCRNISSSKNLNCVST